MTTTSSIKALTYTQKTDEPVLGDSFLRAAYVVYDQDNGNIHLAQAADCGAHENLVAISSGRDAVPSTSGDCTGATATAATRTLDIGTAATVTTDIGAVTSAVGPGPEGTGAATTSSGTFCLTCTKTSHAGAKATATKGAAAGGRLEGGSVVGVVGAAAFAVWAI